MSEDISDDEIRRIAAKLGAPVPKLSSDAPPSPQNTVCELVDAEGDGCGLMPITDGKLRGYERAKKTVVERRASWRRTKIDPTEFKKANEMSPVPTLKPRRIRETYEVYKYSPEYGAEYWVMNKLQYGRSLIYRRCDTETEIKLEVSRLRAAGLQVTVQGKL